LGSTARFRPPSDWRAARPLLGEVTLLAVAGLFMAAVGAFNTADPAVVRPAIYWVSVMVAGGLLGIAIEIPLSARIEGRVRRALALTLLMWVPVAIVVWLVSAAVWGSSLSGRRLLGLGPSVLLVCGTLNAIRYSLRREPALTAEAGEEPVPGAAFRQRLHARSRAAPLYAVEAHDHYLRVHTGAGTELVLMRFADALTELEGLGLQIHRSWWVARDAIEGASWSRGRGELRLVNGAMVPVSRSFAPQVQREGWF
jgi:hypothetical protein